MPLCVWFLEGGTIDHIGVSCYGIMAWVVCDV